MSSKNSRSYQEELVPGAAKQEQGTGWFAAMVVALLVTTVGGGIACALVPPALPWGLMMAAAVAMFIFGSGSVGNCQNGWLELRRRYEDLKDELGNSKREVERFSGFKSTFPTPVAVVSDELVRSAKLVQTAHWAKVVFYQEGLGVDMCEGEPEDVLRAHQAKFAEKEAELEKNVREALDEFRRKRDLAKWYGFTAIGDSWKDHADVHPHGEDRRD